MTDHDSLYHRLFDHPGMVAQLLREFVTEPWLDDLDLDRMERKNAKFHADSGERREGDIVWRIPLQGGGDVYLMLLLEFQSSNDRWMALRAMVYTGLLWQQLEKEKSLLPDGRLPPVLPLVLYNGEPRWSAPLSLRELIGLPADTPHWHWQPEMRYPVIDEGAFSDADLASRGSLAALLFRLESSPTPEQVVILTDELIAWFARHPGFERLVSSFGKLLGGMMGPLAPGVLVPDDLREIRNMLASRAENWKQQWLQEGEQKGQLAGRLEGRLQGQASLLIRQLERRFGALPGRARDQIAAADTGALEEWSLRVLDAASLDEVLS